MLKKIIPLLLLCLLCAAPAYAQGDVFDKMGLLLQRTVRVTSADYSQRLVTLVDAALGGAQFDNQRVKAFTISCETNDIRISFGDAAIATAPPLGHVIASGSSARFPNSDFYRQAYIISKTVGSAATCMVTLEY